MGGTKPIWLAIRVAASSPLHSVSPLLSLSCWPSNVSREIALPRGERNTTLTVDSCVLQSMPALKP